MRQPPMPIRFDEHFHLPLTLASFTLISADSCLFRYTISFDIHAASVSRFDAPAYALISYALAIAAAFQLISIAAAYTGGCLISHAIRHYYHIDAYFIASFILMLDYAASAPLITPLQGRMSYVITPPFVDTLIKAAYAASAACAMPMRHAIVVADAIDATLSAICERIDDATLSFDAAHFERHAALRC